MKKFGFLAVMIALAGFTLGCGGSSAPSGGDAETSTAAPAEGEGSDDKPAEGSGDKPAEGDAAE